MGTIRTRVFAVVVSCVTVGEALLACRGESAWKPPPGASVAPGVPAASASVSPPTDAATARVDAPKPRGASVTEIAMLARSSHRRADDGSCPDYEAAMRTGRARTATGDHQGAIEAFTLALRARPADARAWAELGYSAWLTGKDPTQSFIRARSLTHDRNLLAQIWWNTALFRERVGDAEGARLALVLAEANGSKPATGKLGAASRCAATWTTETKNDDHVTLACDWLEVLHDSNECVNRFDGIVTNADAKRRACLGCVALDRPGDTDVCTGPGPWTVDEGFHGDRSIIQPLPGGRMYVGPVYYGNDDAGSLLARSGEAYGLRTRAPAEHVSWEVTLSEPGEPRLTVDSLWSDELADAGAGAGTQALDAGQHCAPTLAAGPSGSDAFDRMSCMGCGQPVFPYVGPRLVRYYGTGTDTTGDPRYGPCGDAGPGRRPLPGSDAFRSHAGKLRLALTVWNGDVTARIHGAVATVSGGGCEATVALP